MVSGVPYLEIFREKLKDGQEIPLNMQYIRLSGRKLKSNDRFVDRINVFLKAVEQAETLGIGKLGDENFNTILKRFRRNFEPDPNEDKLVGTAKPGYTYKDY